MKACVKVEARAGAPFDLFEAPKSVLSALIPLFRLFRLDRLSDLVLESG